MFLKKSFKAPNSLQTMRLLIVSHVVHYHWDATFYAYAPYAREIEIWAELFETIVIAAPCRNEPPPADAQPIDRSNVSVAAQTEAGGTTWRSKVGLLLAIPSMVLGLAREMVKADAIHVRCPGNLGLVGAVLAPLFSKRLIAKYAGQWGTYPGEALTYRLQRAILRSPWWRGPVTVYGNWPQQSSHVISFFTSVLTAEQIAQAREIVQTRYIRTPVTVAYSGRLTKPKNVDVLIRAIAELKSEAVIVKGLVIGDGPERPALETLVQTLGVTDRIQFTGAIPAGEVVNRLELSDVFVLVSETEGWPKALTEAMTFGLLCIGSNRGLIPQFLSENRGFVVPPGDSAALTQILREIARRPEAYESMGRAASKWASAYSIEGLRDALYDLMTKSWRLSNTADFEASSAPASL
jgi:glycosyltransferase involved in cell wall biosynthesis